MKSGLILSPTDVYMIVISHFKLYPALFSLKWLICIPNISAVRGNVVFETLHHFYRTAIKADIKTKGGRCGTVLHLLGSMFVFLLSAKEADEHTGGNG